MEIKNRLITGGVNPIYNCMAIKQDVIVYGCSNQIYFYDQQKQNKIIQTLRTHKKRVNTVQFLKNTEFSTIISGSADGEVQVQHNKSTNILDIGYSVIDKLKFKGSISFIQVRYAQGQNYILVGDCEGVVGVYSYVEKEQKLQKLDDIQFPNCSVVESGDLIELIEDNKKELVIALGSLDKQIHVYSINIEQQITKFQYKLSLKGHTDAINSLSFKYFKNQEQNQKYILLASCSKSNFIRIHKIQLKKDLADLENYDKKTSFSLDQNHQISLDSVLKGHTEAVVSVKWGLHTLGGDETNEEHVALLSASFDFSLIIWGFEQGIWISKARLGQMSGNKQAIFNAQFSENFEQIISYTYTGQFHIWERTSKTELTFTNLNTVSGNISYVTDLDWDSTHNFLVCGSQDQTTRIYAENSECDNWHELSRAQIHGYDINSVKLLKVQQDDNKEKKFCDLLICGADEKVLRLLEPPAYFLNFINNQKNDNKPQLRLYIPDEKDEQSVLEQDFLQKGIYQYKTQSEGGLQVLGLMTKQVVVKEKINNYHDYTKNTEEGEDGPAGDLANPQQEKKELEVIVERQDFTKMPSEDFLQKHTLWPELNKFYGHGYEISCVSSNNAGSVIVSACKSQTKDQSVILFYDPKTYAILDKLEFHNYTVLQLEFSHNDQFLGSVSRDRQFSLFKLNSETKKYEPFFADQSHTRIIWGLNFSFDDQYVITGARDKRIKIWKIQDDQNQEKKVVKVLDNVYKQPVTAVAFSQQQPLKDEKKGEFMLVAIGFENGNIEIYKFFQNTVELVSLGNIPEFYGHSNIIKRLKFRRQPQGSEKIQLASCSSDHSMRVFEISLKQ